VPHCISSFFSCALTAEVERREPLGSQRETAVFDARYEAAQRIHIQRERDFVHSVLKIGMYGSE
jgi:hypothetical protein